MNPDEDDKDKNAPAAEADDAAETEEQNGDGADESESGDQGADEGPDEGESGDDENSTVDEPNTDRQNLAAARAEEATRRAEDATRRAEDAERRLRDSETRENQRLSQKDLEEKLARMTPEERLDYKANQAMARVDHAQKIAEFKNQDIADRSEFLSKISNNPSLLAMKEEVENRLADLRKQGQNVSREVMLKFIIGEKGLNAALKGSGRKQRNAAQENVRRATTKSPAGRGNVNGSGTTAGKSAKERLANIVF